MTKRNPDIIKAKKSLGTKTPTEFVRARKALGQNFLSDNLAIGAIIKSINPKSTDVIVEIGPGHGELTIPILKSGARVIAIEKDSSLAKKLVSSLAEEIHKEQLEVIDGDVLRELSEIPYKLKTINYKLCGNIPYYITGFLLRIIADLDPKPKTIVLTIQKEVAERICAKPPQMNLLAASVQFWGKPEIIAIIPRESFNPIPKVDSAVIRITPLKTENLKLKTAFYNFIKVLFKQPRKTILNNLRGVLDAKTILSLDIDPAARPQNLSLQDIIKLAKKAHKT